MHILKHPKNLPSDFQVCVWGIERCDVPTNQPKLYLATEFHSVPSIETNILWSLPEKRVPSSPRRKHRKIPVPKRSIASYPNHYLSPRHLASRTRYTKHKHNVMLYCKKRLYLMFPKLSRRLRFLGFRSQMAKKRNPYGFVMSVRPSVCHSHLFPKV